MAFIKKETVINTLMQCYDPEIPIDLWSLGLIYDIKIEDSSQGKSKVNIIMTLTTPGCTMGNLMATDIKTKLEKIDGITNANIEVTFDPPWEPKMMNDEARVKLGFKTNSELEAQTDDKNTEWE